MAHPYANRISFTNAPATSMLVITLNNLFLYTGPPLPYLPPSDWLRLFSSQNLSLHKYANNLNPSPNQSSLRQSHSGLKIHTANQPKFIHSYSRGKKTLVFSTIRQGLQPDIKIVSISIFPC